MATPIIVNYLKQIEKPHGSSLNHWFGGLMNFTVQMLCDLQYITMRFIIHINYPTEPEFIALQHDV